jgi:gas vesicle protein
MFKDAPTSYKDPFWSSLAAQAEKKVGLPPGLLQSILIHGEKSNADQVSSAGAKTPFQIIPQTRQGIIKNYGIDPYLSPELAAEGAALLLKESLDRNKGSVPAAVREYHGGLNRKQWGPVNRAYADRVLTAFNQTTMSDADVQTLPEVTVTPTIAEGGRVSTFEALGGMEQPDDQSLMNIFEAYRSGQMDDQSKAEFEADVRSGAIMLPRGATLEGVAEVTEETGRFTLPEPVLRAYFTNQMDETAKRELEEDVAADRVTVPGGSLDAARSQFFAQTIPGAQPFTPTVEQPTTVGEDIIGALETGGALLSGATTGALGMAGAMGAELTRQILSGEYGTQDAVRDLEEAAIRGGEALTYAPRTQAGQQQLQVVGETLAPLIPVTPLTGELALLGRTTAQAAPVVRATTEQAVQRGIVQPVQRAAGAVSDATGRAVTAGRGALGIAVPEAPPPTAGTAGSVGAAGVDMATVRQGRAAELPVPVRMTEGQRTREFGQQRFEREIAKDPELGEPIRQRLAQQQQQISQNFDAFIDATGAEIRESLGTVGETVTQAIRERAARDKTKIRTLYKKAENAGQMADPVDLAPLADYLNANRAGRRQTPILATIAEELKVQGVALGDLADGTLSIGSMTLKQAEDIRKAINKFYSKTDPNDARVAAEMKQLIDDITQDVGGDLYKEARAARTQYANDYENIGLIKSLIDTKRGSADRIIALENVVEKSIYSPSTSLESVKQLKRILDDSGDAGKQAWNELKGATIEYIRDRAYSKVETDQAGNRIISPAALERTLTALDKSGKLDFVFGKKTAEQLRTINDVAKDLFTVPAGSVNYSNTASVLTQALDTIVTYGATGLPFPAMQALKASIKNVKQKEIKKRVEKALE